MSLRELEAAILRELREVAGKKKLRQKDIQEWSTGVITPQGEEKVVFLPEQRVYVAYLDAK